MQLKGNYLFEVQSIIIWEVNIKVMNFINTQLPYFIMVLLEFKRHSIVRNTNHLVYYTKKFVILEFILGLLG